MIGQNLVGLVGGRISKGFEIQLLCWTLEVVQE